MNIRLAIFTTATAFIFIGNNLAAAQPGRGPAAGTSSVGVDKTEGNQAIGFGRGTGIGAGGFAGSASSLAGGLGSASSGSGAGSQNFGGGFTQQQAPSSGPLSTGGAGAGGASAGGAAMRPR